MASILEQAKSALHSMGSSIGRLVGVVGKDATGSGKKLSEARTAVGNVAKQMRANASAAGALVAHSQAGDKFKLVEKCNLAAERAEQIAGRINDIGPALDELQGFMRAAEKAAKDSGSSL